MDEQTPTSSAPSGKKGSGKLKDFIKKNKTLSAVLGLGGIYILFKETQSNGESTIEGPGENIVSPGGPYEAVEPSHEGTDEEIARVEEENRQEREDREEGERERENENKEGGGSNESGGTGTETPEERPPEGSTGSGETPGGTGGGSNGLSVNGKEFAGATGKSIVGTGTSENGKKWIEYLITFPGRQEHWRYFPATGNWSQMKNSATGPGSGKKPTESSKTPTNPGSGGSPGGQAKPPANNPNHPDAINTGNACVNGGVGPHTAPTGYHLFCENGWIWRAPDKAAVAPARKVLSSPRVKAREQANKEYRAAHPEPAPTPPPRASSPGPPQCPNGTVDNIHHSRNEVQRLQGEINDLNNAINAHPNAKERQGWINNRNGKQDLRDQFQGAVDRGRQVPGCGNV